MAGINQVTIVGNVGQNPEVKFMTSGDAVCNISVATSETWKDKNSGERKEATEWHRVVMYGKTAEIAGEYVKKGSQVGIQGKLKTRKWQDQSGADRYTTEIVCEKLTLLGKRESGGGQSDDSGFEQHSSANHRQQPARPAPAPNQQSTADLDDDIPF